MKKLLLFVAFATITVLKLQSQTPDTLICDVPDRDTTEAEHLPWFGNNDYLENFLDSIGYNSGANRIIGPDRVKYHVPIKFWVYRNSDDNNQTKFNLNISNLRKGFYILKVQQGKYEQSEKIMIE